MMARKEFKAEGMCWRGKCIRLTMIRRVGIMRKSMKMTRRTGIWETVANQKVEISIWSSIACKKAIVKQVEAKWPICLKPISSTTKFIPHHKAIPCQLVPSPNLTPTIINLHTSSKRPFQDPPIPQTYHIIIRISNSLLFHLKQAETRKRKDNRRWNLFIKLSWRKDTCGWWWKKEKGWCDSF